MSRACVVAVVAMVASAQGQTTPSLSASVNGVSCWHPHACMRPRGGHPPNAPQGTLLPLVVTRPPLQAGTVACMHAARARGPLAAAYRDTAPVGAAWHDGSRGKSAWHSYDWSCNDITD
jgi:hypothetical protein